MTKNFQNVESEITPPSRQAGSRYNDGACSDRWSIHELTMRYALGKTRKSNHRFDKRGEILL